MRVPTYASYVNLLNASLKNKEQLDLYSFQATTGLKSPTYAGYGATAFNIVSLEASLNVTKNFMANNDLLNIEIKAMNTSMESIYELINDFKSSLTSFSGNDLDLITPDYTGGEITFGSDNVADYVGKTLTIDGVKYTFANDGNGNNIDISQAKNGEEVLNALKSKLENAPNPPEGFSEFTFEGNKVTFPLYTVNGSSSVLNVDGVTTGEPHTMNGDQAQAMAQLQQLAFSTMQAMVDCLNTSANGKYLFGGGVSNQAPINFPFRTLEEFQQYYNGTSIQYPTNGNANLSNWEFDAKQLGDLELSRKADDPSTGVIKATGGSFLTTAVTSGAETTGSLTFNADKNTVMASQYGAFNTLKAGDTLVIGGADAGTNAKFYIVESVSSDGKTLTLSEETPIEADATLTADQNVTFSTSLPVGSVVDMNGFNNNISPQVQVTGVSADGTELYVSVDDSRWPAAGETTTVAASSKWSLSSSSYYQGGTLSSERMISENQSVTMDITAADPAFEKLFRALGEIAQGNLVDDKDPRNEFDGLIDVDRAGNRVEEALDLLQDGIYNGGKTSSQQNGDLYTVMAKINSNYVVLNTTMESQTLVQKNLEDSVSSLKTTDRTEAAAMAIIAAGNLEASYAVLQQVMNVSLLNYLK